MTATTVEKLLGEHNLGAYADAFDDAGWDDLSQLQAITHQRELEFVQLVKDRVSKMKSGRPSTIIAGRYYNLGTSPWSPWPYFKLDCRRRRRQDEGRYSKSPGVG